MYFFFQYKLILLTFNLQSNKPVKKSTENLIVSPINPTVLPLISLFYSQT